jgi:hypothetical protein
MQINLQNQLGTNLSLDITLQPGPAPTGRYVRANLGPGDSVDVGDVASLEEINRNADVQTLVESGALRITVVEETTDIFSAESQFNKLRNDVAVLSAGNSGNTTIFHKANPDSVGLVESPDASGAGAPGLASVVLLANEERAKIVAHFASIGDLGAHLAASAEVIAAPAATDQTTANTLLDELKADLNDAMNEAGHHIVADATNAVSAAAATDLATSITLANDIKAVFNAHVIAAMDSLPLGSS